MTTTEPAPRPAAAAPSETLQRSPIREAHPIEQPRTGSQLALARLATALAAVATGALAIGALAIARLAIGRLAIRLARFDKVAIRDLEVDRLRVRVLVPPGT